jgi:oxidase EvaA
MVSDSVAYNFIQSALSETGPNDIEEILEWLEKERCRVKHTVKRIAFNSQDDWFFENESGNLVHKSGKFFSIRGIQVRTNWGRISEWSQPIIDQPEVGFLGVIAKEIDGVLSFLMQAKIEPGNINGVQLSPTLQATKSNYTRVHDGETPPYLEYFVDENPSIKILLDQLQSEQGARFLKKRNRNIIVQIEGDIEVREGFRWMTLRQIKELMSYDNLVNMDTRTVISGIPLGDSEMLDLVNKNEINSIVQHDCLISELDATSGINSMKEIMSWITKLKVFAELEVTPIALNMVNHWQKDEKSIFHIDRKYFEIILVKTEIDNREVRTWNQPLIRSAQEGIIAFIIKRINGVYHFLVQAKMEPGNFDIIELAPTVQCLTGNYRKGKNEYEVPYLDVVLNYDNYEGIVHYSTMQSEEGGRFYKEQNKNMIIEVGDKFSNDVSDKYIWMTLNQLKTFINFDNYVNIQARSLLASIKYV